MSKSPIKVLLVDDHVVVLEGLARILKSYKDLSVVGVAHTGKESIAKANELQPDVVIMDIKLPDMSGIEATLKIKAQNKKVAVLMLTMFFERDIVCGAVQAGVSGYMVKECDSADLLEAVRVAASGGLYMCPKSTAVMADSEGVSSAMSKLTRREMDVLCELKKGHDAQESADALRVKLHTVNTHRRSIMKKLKANHIQQLLASIYQDDRAVFMPSEWGGGGKKAEG